MKTVNHHKTVWKLKSLLLSCESRIIPELMMHGTIPYTSKMKQQYQVTKKLKITVVNNRQWCSQAMLVVMATVSVQLVC